MTAVAAGLSKRCYGSPGISSLWRDLLLLVEHEPAGVGFRAPAMTVVVRSGEIGADAVAV